MKKIASILSFLFILSFYSSTSFAQIQFNNAESVIDFSVGEWIWTSSCGGFSGSDCTYPNTTHTKSIIFTNIIGATDIIAYAQYENNLLTFSGTSKVSFSQSIYGLTWNIETISGFFSEKEVFDFNSQNEITLRDNCNDCYDHSFMRKGGLNTIGYATTDNRVLLYPNPSHRYFYADLNHDTAWDSVTICNIGGRIVKEIQRSKDPLDITELSKGIYFVELHRGVETYRTRIIKE